MTTKTLGMNQMSMINDKLWAVKNGGLLMWNSISNDRSQAEQFIKDISPVFARYSDCHVIRVKIKEVKLERTG